MERLLINTTAYKILSGDRRSERLSHAYMLHFQDPKNLRAALKLFALEFFGADKNSSTGQRILNESYTDFKLYPEDGGKIAVDGVSEIIEDSSMRPVEGGKKLYAICGFESASPLIQNKLLKTLEEPLDGVHFILGACSLAPVLDTVKSRVKILEIPPFTESEIYSALERRGHREINAAAARSSGGILGAAENMAEGGWFKDVLDGAREICFTRRKGDIGAVAAKYGDTKYKAELLSEMQRLYFSALTEGGKLSEIFKKSTLVYALESLNAANADLKFNAYFQALLYDFMLRVIAFEDGSTAAKQ